MHSHKGQAKVVPLYKGRETSKGLILYSLFLKKWELSNQWISVKRKQTLLAELLKVLKRSISCIINRRIIAGSTVSFSFYDVCFWAFVSSKAPWAVIKGYTVFILLNAHVLIYRYSWSLMKKWPYKASHSVSNKHLFPYICLSEMHFNTCKYPGLLTE